MIREMDMVVLTHDVPKHNLQKDDVGVIVHCYPKNLAYEVEFVTAEGTTVALLTLTSADIRPIADREILHVREVAPAVV